MVSMTTHIIIYIFKAKNFLICFTPTAIFFISFVFIQLFFLKSVILKSLSIILTLTSIISGLITLILNPGIIYNLKKEGKETKNKIYCFQCRFEYPHLGQSLTHCDDCGVCYIGMDHHCDVFGKCIAKNNLSIFTIFFTCICFLFVIDFTSLGFITSPKPKHKLI